MGKLLGQILTLDNLSQAWDEVTENKSGAGSDGVTVEVFARAWEARLIELQTEIRGNRYHPAPLQWFTVPKADGSPRWLANLTVRDKVSQRAVLRVLDDLYEPQFLNCSYGYRPKRSVQQVVEQIVMARDMGYQWVLDADIDDFFHSVDHALLLRFLQETITDTAVLNLLRLWLKHHRPKANLAVGTVMGAIVSPLLANVYLHYLDLAMTGGSWEAQHIAIPQWRYLRYADDFVVLCRSEAEAQTAYEYVAEMLANLRLSFKPRKTRLTNFEEGFTYLGCHFQGEAFTFEHEQRKIKVREDEDWRLFYEFGPTGYE